MKVVILSVGFPDSIVFSERERRGSIQIAFESNEISQASLVISKRSTKDGVSTTYVDIVLSNTTYMPLACIAAMVSLHAVIFPKWWSRRVKSRGL